MANERELLDALIKAADDFAVASESRVQIKIRPHKHGLAVATHNIDVNNPKISPKALADAAKQLGRPWTELSLSEQEEVVKQFRTSGLTTASIRALRWEKKPSGQWTNYDYTATARAFR